VPVVMTIEAAANHARPATGKRLWSLSLGATGVVFGDIGTSPLYAFKECLKGAPGGATHLNVFGLLSLILWAVTLVVTIKYLAFIMRADNHGEGGVFALLAMLPRGQHKPHRLGLVTLLGVVGAALLYGDGIVTPAISVLSALEGLEVATPALHAWVVPLTCVTLLGLFAIQRRGTGDIGKLFGPIMVVWFVTIAVLGARRIVEYPHVLQAASPTYAIAYFAEHGVTGALILGAVVLAVTGGEALYADMGHFGTRPIRIAWFALALPALVLAYFGQGALVLQNPHLVEYPFFALVDAGPARYLLVALASMATVIASQALISGAFSLTKQAIQLGYLPRLRILHTAWEAEGQVYVPAVNWALALCSIALVLSFRESGRLAAAYGIAVSGTMTITSIVFFDVVRKRWGWPLSRALPLLLFFLLIDLPFLFANSIKLLDGGYVPVVVGAVMVCVMLVWKRGQLLFAEQLAERAEPLGQFLASGVDRLTLRVPGTAVFVTRDSSVVPPALQRQIDAIPALQERVFILSVRVEQQPSVPAQERMQIEDLGKGFLRVNARYGFMEEPDLPALVHEIRALTGQPFDEETATYYLRRETFLATPQGRMGSLSEGLFSFLSRNAHPVDAYFKIPRKNVFEVGAQFDL
jgi:KUP system potassium uptake protein